MSVTLFRNDLLIITFPNAFLQVNGKMENIMGKAPILTLPVLEMSLRNQVTFFFVENIISF